MSDNVTGNNVTGDNVAGDNVAGDTPKRPDDEPDVEERSIAQVGSPSRQTNVLVVVFGIAIVGMLLWFVNRGDEEDSNARLTDPEPLEFKAPLRREPPRLPGPEPAPPQTDPAEQNAALDPMQAEL